MGYKILLSGNNKDLSIKIRLIQKVFFLINGILVIFFFFNIKNAICANRANERIILDDFEKNDSFERWSIRDPEASIFHSKEIVYSGKYSIRFNIDIDYSRGSNPEYPKGWIFFNRRFYEFVDWTGYKGLKFYIYVPSDQPNPGMIKYGIKCGDTRGEPRWHVISHANITPGKWNKIVLPLNSNTVSGSLDNVTEIIFYVAEAWYKDGDELNFYLDDFSLLKHLPEEEKKVQTEIIRKPGRHLSIPANYLRYNAPLVYPVIPLEFIYADTDLSSRKHIKRFYLRVAKGEVKALTFAILAGDKKIRNLRIKISYLKDKKGNILDKDIADIRVVKIWEQAALSYQVLTPKDKILVPELLLKDDRIPLKDKRTEKGYYIPPSVLNIPCGTDIPAHTLKQIWINFFIPTDIPSGRYQGTIFLNAKKGLREIIIPLTIEVLDFNLPSPKFIYGIYYRWRLSKTIPTWYISKKSYIYDLRNLKEVGFESVTINTHKMSIEEIRQMIECIKEVGLNGYIVMVGVKTKERVKKILKINQNYNLPLYFYGVDEPNDEKRLHQHKKISALLHDSSAKVVTALLPQTLEMLISEGEPLDWANFPMENGESAIHIARFRKKTEKLAPIQTYYWQLYEENPTRNRFYTGFYLWQSGMDGVFPFEYQGFPFALAYEKDTRKSTWRTVNPRTFRAFCVTYPSQEGPVTTLQWEGCRQGINDVRYLTYLDELLRLSEKKISSIEILNVKKKLKNILSRFDFLPSSPSVYTNPYIEPQIMETAREEIINLILELETKLQS